MSKEEIWMTLRIARLTSDKEELAVLAFAKELGLKIEKVELRPPQESAGRGCVDITAGEPDRDGEVWWQLIWHGPLLSERKKST